MKKEPDQLPRKDPFWFDQEGLQAIAEREVVRNGLEDYRENRVMEIDQDRELLWGLVEDFDSDASLEVEIRSGEKGLNFTCNCESGRAGAVCRHMVAVLLQYGDQCGETDQLLTASDNAIRERIKRGRSEVEVEPLSDESWFGSWRATSLSGATPFSRSYEVTIRSLQTRSNYCTCPDFAGNQLGTCKHIEAVLHKISKHPRYEEFKHQAAPYPYLYLAWDVEDAPRLQLHRAEKIASELAEILNGFFTVQGTFKGRLPDDFFRFQELIESRNDFHLGEDAILTSGSWRRPPRTRRDPPRSRNRFAPVAGCPESRPDSTPTRSRGWPFWPVPAGRCWRMTWDWARRCRRSALRSGCGKTKGYARS